MNLPAFCIKRPVFTVMMVMLPVVLGLISLGRIGVDLFPNVELPIVMVTTARPGASVEEMETGVTKVIEETVNTISGIDELRSTTTEGVSLVVISFDLSKDRDIAQQEVQSKINTVLSRLPTGTETPIIDKFDVDAAPVVILAVSGDRPMRELTEIAETRIGENLSSLPGVGAVFVVGGQKRAVNVTIDAQKLEAFGISIAEVTAALSSQNLELPGGRVEQDRRELVLRTVGRVVVPEQFADVIVKAIDGQPIRIRDLGSSDVVEDSVERTRSLARLNGQNSVLLVVQKQSGSNTVDVIDTVKARVSVLDVALDREGLSDLTITPMRDQSVFINASVHEVQVHLVLGAILVVLTILLFLRNWRATIIAATAIPVSLVAAFPVMWAFGMTFNNITLVAMVLMIGIVIDDAVIVIENIFRWMEEGHLSPLQASLKGASEIMFPVLATSLSLVVIFLPIAFMGGTVGMFLRSFGITCAIAILASLGVSLTLTPMLSSLFLKLKPKPGHETENHHSGGVYGWLAEKPYMASLRFAMRHRLLVVGTTAVLVLSVAPLPFARWPGLVGMVGFNFLPQDDQSEFLVGITAPEGWSLEKTNEVFSQITRRVVAWPEVVDVMEIVGDIRGRQAEGEGPVNVGNIYVRLVDLEEREGDWSQADIMDRARQLLRDYPDLRASVSVPAQVQAGGANADVQFQLMGPDLDQLQSYADKMVAQLRQVPGLVDVDTTLTGRKPELRVEVDRERAADLGVDIRTISSTLGALVGGRIVTDYRDAQMGELYDVWLRAEGVDRSDPEAVRNLTVPAEGGELIRLGSVADTLPGQGPSQIDRADRQRTINLIANLNGLPGATASEEFYRAFESLGAPPTYSLQPTGRAKEEARSVMAFVMAFVFSLIFMYMVLAAQFESFVHPITILLAVPLTIPFALITLIALGEPLTLFAVLGLFLLFGIVKKNGILQVDYSNVLRRNASDDPSIVPAPYRPVSPSAAGDDRRGISRWEKWVSGRGDDERVRLWAILEANRVRLRPILMTTFMLVTAMIPIALGEGPGAANRAAVAKVIIGGQSLSLLLSLLVTPVAYSLFDDVQLWFGRRFRRERRAVIRSSELGDLAPAVSRLEPHPAPYSGNGDSLRE